MQQVMDSQESSLVSELQDSGMLLTDSLAPSPSGQ